jgi:hypothetical protein
MTRDIVSSVLWTLRIMWANHAQDMMIRYSRPVIEETAFVALIAEYLYDHSVCSLSGARFEMIPHSFYLGEEANNA